MDSTSRTGRRWSSGSAFWLRVPSRSTILMGREHRDSSKTTVIHPDLLAILACPVSRQPLAHADDALLGRVNERIAAGGVQNVGGTAVSNALESALVREDGTLVYPVRDDIPVLLREEGIEVGPADS